ncbi:ferric reductase-like transmembrane domain-containing protein [Desulforhopalus vacuolatus]|uniref:ferric reductase-like transmembrane domain-containing protein n=1 Tax=Desulforhopalus vacuolatus TaxID=40414 RepID=UPI001965301F|nr:ferric reductase-like transmembrane domain-containing protein [Desulforhopalus vacuolatus]MBM9520813.1 ferric reductase-like transmembrane domain-containing protein [Desulforhopalus vacuolatus]
MHVYIKSKTFWLSLLLFTAVPLLILWAGGTVSGRSLYMETLSVLTIIAFFQLIGQFFLTRGNRYAVKELTMNKVLISHKCTGYIFVLIILFHPLFVLIPRFTEAGISPGDALITMITTMNGGIISGLIAWCTLLTLGGTSLFRKRLPMKYRSWRVLHGVLAILFAGTAVWHAVNLGRHVTLVMSVVLCLLAAGGVALLFKVYATQKGLSESGIEK